MKKEIVINDENGKPIWFAKIEIDQVSLEFEAFADTQGGTNIETIYSISADKYQKIFSKYDLQKMPIDQALQTISDNGLGKGFLIWSIENQIAVKAFTWVSYDD